MHLLYPTYGTFNEALQKLDFGFDTYVVQITDDYQSLEYIRPDKHVIKVVGTGVMAAPGKPGGNQYNNRQLLFYRTLIRDHCVPVLHKYVDGLVEFLGYYRLLNTKIKLTDTGFRYFEFTLQKYNKTSDMS
jgi:hypothetical protein